MSQNKVVYGLKNVHIAFVTDDGYKTPVAIKGAVSLSLSPEGETTPFYADDTVYFLSLANNGYSGDMEFALLTDEIKAEMLGWEIDSYGAIVETTSGQPKKFALLGEVTGDKKNRRFVYYDVQASRPDENAKTKEGGISIEGEKLPIKITPVILNGKETTKAVLELNAENAEKYNAFYENVYIPFYGILPNSRLKSLSFGNATLTPEFEETTYIYELETTDATNTITAVANDAQAVIEIKHGDNVILNGKSVEWEQGLNTITITVTVDSSVTTYTITVNKTTI